MQKIVCRGALLYARTQKDISILPRTKGKQSKFMGLGGTNENEETSDSLP